MKLFAAFGVTLTLLGVAALIHPHMGMPAKQDEIQIGREKEKIRIQRFVTIPAAFSAMVILAGGALILLGTRRR
jgi:hypothetical protein